MAEQHDPLIGQTLEGRFLVLSQLGKGGMGLVYAAEDVQLLRRCALKVLRPEFAEDPANVERFLREAQAIAGLSHAHIVNIFSLGRDPSGAVFFAMELLVGDDLEVRLRDRTRPVHWREVCEWSIQICRAVAAVHEAGLVHRDLKPGNVFLARRRDGSESVKLLDFGIVRPEESEMTSTGATLGTPHYMSPEQVRAQPLDRRSDIYAFGILLFRAVTGRLPFRGEPFQVAIMHVENAAPNPSDTAPDRDLPPALSDLILTALQKDPAARFQTMLDVEHALQAILRDHPAHTDAAPTARPDAPARQLVAPPPSPPAPPIATPIVASPARPAASPPPPARPSADPSTRVLRFAASTSAASSTQVIRPAASKPTPRPPPPGPEPALETFPTVPKQPAAATPPEPPPPATSPELSGVRLSSSPSVARPRRRLAPLVAVVGVLVVLVAVYVATRPPPAAPPTPTPTPTPTPVVAAAPARPAPAPTAAPEPPTPAPVPTPAPPEPAPTAAPVVAPEPPAPTATNTARPAATPKKPPPPVDPHAALQKLARACRRTHAALDAPKIDIDYAVASDGKVTRAVPSQKSELGKCLAEAVRRTVFAPKLMLGQRVEL